jgi:hypothetical protein
MCVGHATYVIDVVDAGWRGNRNGRFVEFIEVVVLYGSPAAERQPARTYAIRSNFNRGR